MWIVDALNKFVENVWYDDGTRRPREIIKAEYERAGLGPPPRFVCKEENATDSQRKEDKESHD